MDLKQIQDLIKFVSKSGVSEVNLEKDDIKLTIKTGKDADEKKEDNQQLPVYAQMMPPGMMQQPMPQQQMPQQQSQGQPAQEQGTHQEQQPASGSQQKDEASEDDSNLVAIKSPMIGTFYRSPSPEKGPYVKVGDQVKKGDTVCVVEAMKLFNEIEAETSGKIVKVLVDDAAPVEYDQPLFMVDPS